MVIDPNETYPKGHLPHRNASVTPRGKALLELAKMGTPRLRRARYALEHARDFYDRKTERWARGAHWFRAPGKRASFGYAENTQPYAACLAGAVCLRRKEGAGFVAADTSWLNGTSGSSACSAMSRVLRTLHPGEDDGVLAWNDRPERRPEQVFDLIDETLGLIELIVGRRKR